VSLFARARALSLSLWQLIEMAKEKKLVVTSVEDVACYRGGRFQVPSFFDSADALNTLGN
jgi:hypothetical protein